VLSPTLLNALVSLLYLNLFTGLKIEQRFHYKIRSLTHNALDTSRPTYLRSRLTVQDIRNTRSALIVSLVHATNPSRLKITNRSFFHMAPVLWNRLPTNLRARSQCLAGNSSASPSPFAFLLLNSMLNSNLISSIILLLLTSFSSAGRILLVLDMASGFFSSYLSFSFTHLIIFTHCLPLDVVFSV
jgi:hypothetical protein